MLTFHLHLTIECIYQKAHFFSFCKETKNTEEIKLFKVLNLFKLRHNCTIYFTLGKRNEESFTTK